MDYYSILGIEKSASQKEIKSAYRKLANRYHPDKNKNINDSEKIKKINEAYNILGNVKKRMEYDNKKTNTFNGFENMNFDFQDIFNGTTFGKNKKRNPIKKTFDQKLEITIQICFEEAILGLQNKEIQYNFKKECSKCKGYGGQFVVCEYCNGSGYIKKNDGFISINTTCSECKGTGKSLNHGCDCCGNKGYVYVKETLNIKIPEGLEQRTKLFVKNKGNYVNGSRGDLYITAEIIKHDVYKRKGNNILMNFEADVFDVMMNNIITINTLRDEFDITLDPEMINTPLIRKGLGTKSVNGEVYGDLIITFSLKIPAINKQQKKLLRQIQNNKS